MSTSFLITQLAALNPSGATKPDADHSSQAASGTNSQEQP